VILSPAMAGKGSSMPSTKERHQWSDWMQC
jgi:hypothetical protein